MAKCKTCGRSTIKTPTGNCIFCHRKEEAAARQDKHESFLEEYLKDVVGKLMADEPVRQIVPGVRIYDAVMVILLILDKASMKCPKCGVVIGGHTDCTLCAALRSQKRDLIR